MKALVYEGIRQVRLREIAEPVVGAGEARVHVSGVGVCGSDLALFRDGAAGRIKSIKTIIRFASLTRPSAAKRNQPRHPWNRPKEPP